MLTGYFWVIFLVIFVPPSFFLYFVSPDQPSSFITSFSMSSHDSDTRAKRRGNPEPLPLLNKWCSKRVGFMNLAGVKDPRRRASLKVRVSGRSSVAASCWRCLSWRNT